MSKELSEKERIDVLSGLLDRVLGWQRAAETKNGALLTLAFATIGVALRIGYEGGELFPKCLWGFGLFLCLLATLILFLAFIPRLNIWYDRFMHRSNGESGDNNYRGVVFFGHLVEMSSSEIESKMSGVIGIRKNELSFLEKDLIYQIHVNSGIAASKFEVFSPAAYSFLVGLLLIISVIILF